MSVLDAIAKQYEKSKSGGSSGGSYEQDFSKYFLLRGWFSLTPCVINSSWDTSIA